MRFIQSNGDGRCHNSPSQWLDQFDVYRAPENDDSVFFWEGISGSITCPSLVNMNLLSFPDSLGKLIEFGYVLGAAHSAFHIIRAVYPDSKVELFENPIERVTNESMISH